MLHVLDNGLHLLLQENHVAPVVAMQVWVNTGSADDPVQLSGLAHALEHMAFKGTARRSEGEIAREIEGAGGQINAWTSFDQTVFHVVMASRFFDRGLAILADVLLHSRFGDEELKRELGVILEEIKQGEDAPSRVVSRSLFATAYQRHPYGRPVVGQAAMVRSLTREHLEQFFKARYSAANMTLVMVGDFTSAAVVDRVRQLFRRAPSVAPAPVRRQAEPAQRKLRIVVEHRETQESYVAMAFHIPNLVHADTPALDLAAVILGQGQTSRLNRSIKQELQLVTSCNAYAYTPRDPGLLVIGATTTPAKLVKAVQAMLAEALALGATTVSADELQRAKTLIESDSVFQKETVQGLARKIGFYQTVAGGVAFEYAYNHRIASVTPAELQQVAARYLKPENLSMSVVGPQPKAGEQQLTRDLRDAVAVAKAQVAAAERATVRREEPIIKVTLPNGARLLILVDNSVPLVALRGVWKGGVRYETSETNGMNSLLAALMTRGTTTRSANQINEAIEGMAGSLAGFSGQNSFGIHGSMLAQHWEQGLEILADCLLHPAFAPDEVERERRALLDDILAQEDDPAGQAQRLFLRTFFKNHPYGLDTVGSVDSVSSLGREQLVRYYRRHYHPSSLVLAVAGDVDPERVRAKFKQLLGQVGARAEQSVEVAPEPRRDAPEDAYQFISRQQAHVVVGYPGATLRGRDRYALDVLVSVLSGQGGRLFLELRDRQGLAYQVGAYSQEGLDPGYIAIYTATSPEKVPQALAGIEREVQRLRDELLSAAELKRIQRYLVGTYEISLQRKTTLAAYLAFNEVYGLGYKIYTRYAPSILAVTAEEVRRVARRYLADARRVVAIVKPEERSKGATAQLGSGRQAGVALPVAVPPVQPATKQRKRSAERGR